MRVGRLRSGELLALAGALALPVLLSLRWFDAQGGAAPLHTSGWAALGWALVLLLVLAVAGAVALAGLAGTGSAQALAVAAAVVTVLLALVSWVVLALRVCVFQPALGAGLPNHLVSVQWAGYAGLGALALLGYGAWHALGDERRDAPESAYEPPPARPAPGGAGDTLSA
jgi:amino acid transporter